ncbi:MAG: class I SAM-dependent methyltransferase [Anaerolineales bacterium]|jgi:demethylmenaquinone methyltransferase/2-methoxy-6-polyprenyl-1,4-benzoquinol methylase|nr:class I SAM-dependent methyltransferase [Anaerolineales bacterium]
MPAFDHFALIAPMYARVSYSKVAVMRAVAELPVHGRLLDVGGGTGRVATAIRDLVDDVVIADVSVGMLREAPLSTLQPVCGGSEALPFADESFERVIMVDALHHVIDHAHTAREMFRVLKTGGVLVIEEPDIRTFGVKLIALAEKLLLMRSHFLAPDEIAELFADREKTIRVEDSTAWVIIRK